MQFTQPHNPPIAIKTSWGRLLGMGHIQRMTSLLWYLNEFKNIKTFLLPGDMPDSFPVELRKYVKTDMDFLPCMIIRDMRDSLKDEITALKKTARVLAIDDNGQGRRVADYAIDILPNPDAENKKAGLNPGKIFLYGYNFLRAVFELKDKAIKKELDFAVYPGYSAGKEYIGFLTSLIPTGSSYAVLNSKDSYLIKDGEKRSLSLKESSYAEILLSSKAVISHFGITLYEGFISGCRLFAINPTEYHSKLSDMIKDDLRLINLGEYKKIDMEMAVATIKNAAEIPLCEFINAGDVYKKIINELEEFYKLLISLI